MIQTPSSFDVAREYEKARVRRTKARWVLVTGIAIACVGAVGIAALVATLALPGSKNATVYLTYGARLAVPPSETGGIESVTVGAPRVVIDARGDFVVYRLQQCAADAGANSALSNFALALRGHAHALTADYALSPILLDTGIDGGSCVTGNVFTRSGPHAVPASVEFGLQHLYIWEPGRR